jgi:hypothetical protein
MIILESIGVGVFWVMWWFASAFIAEQVANDKGAEKRHVSARFANGFATIPLIVLFIYRLNEGLPLIYGPGDAALIFLPYLFVLILISNR